MEELASAEGLVVSQKKEWGEIFTGFETKNKYLVLNSQGEELFAALEEGGSTMMRLLLKALRPFEIHIRRLDGKAIMRVTRPFRFYFHELEIYDANNTLLGSIKREFSVIRRIYSILDPNGNKVYQLFGPLLHPWTFTIHDQDEVYGEITKKWSGFLKESFSDADNFGITFPVDWPVETKAIFLGAVFLIDFVHFENSD